MRRGSRINKESKRRKERAEERIGLKTTTRSWHSLTYPSFQANKEPKNTVTSSKKDYLKLPEVSEYIRSLKLENSILNDRIIKLEDLSSSMKCETNIEELDSKPQQGVDIHLASLFLVEEFCFEQISMQQQQVSATDNHIPLTFRKI